jgi:uncharacterized protein (DUF2132 family)
VLNLFARNERVVACTCTAHGLVLVGATIVASIETIWAGNIAPTKAEEGGALGFTGDEAITLQRAPRWACSNWAVPWSACLARACWPVSSPTWPTGSPPAWVSPLPSWRSRHERASPPPQKNNPLHGLTLEAIVTALVAHYGWEALGQQINIRCFTDNPSIKSSLKFLRKTLGREKVESLYLYVQRKQAKERSDAMAFKITYTYKKQAREIGYANDKFNSIYDAIAAAEGSI